MSYSSRFVDLTIALAKDRFVTPTFYIPSTAQGAKLHIPTPDDASDIFLQAAPLPHRFNYPMRFKDYPSQNITFEFDFDDVDGERIVDVVSGIILDEQGDPTFQTSAAAGGLGKGLVFDGTGDALDCLVENIPQGVLPTTGDFSVEVVFKATNTTTDTGDTIIACRTGAAGIGWQLEFEASELLDFHLEDEDGEIKLTGATDAATDAIVHAIASLDRDGNGVLYINGVADDTTDISTAEKTVKPVKGASNRLSIGGDAARTGGDCLYGNVYFARLYNGVALSAAQALENYNTLMGGIAGLAYPGWLPVVDPVDGDDWLVNASTKAPGITPIPDRIFKGMKGSALRVLCATEQTTSPTALKFMLELS